MRAIIDGYYNPNDGNFYRDAEYTTVISPSVNNVYRDFTTNNMYEWTGSAYSVIWINPKTDWMIRLDEAGAYIGDYINLGDYNRIKNNVGYILSIASEVVYGDYPTMGADKAAYTEYPRAGEWNDIETALNLLATNIHGSFPVLEFMENGNTPDTDELNRIERMTLRLKNQYEVAAQSKYKLPFTLGRGSNVIRV